MIALLRGRVAWIEADAAVVDVNGVGYRVHCPTRVLERLGSGQQVELRTEMISREDGIFLYGFLDAAELAWFRVLRNVQGVGARLALSLLSTLSPDDLQTAVAARDHARLARAPGIGPRLARRIVSELEARIGTLPAAASAAAPAAVGAAAGPVADAVAALVHLGYGRSEAWSAVARARRRLAEAGEGEPSVDRLVREALKELAP
ncbi:Holliday junction ATP-dependent DNA helicase RuvA [bacterium HR39]|nr:Holliday junction ATP-dependent DNA helicase RuvA [bacterium HR39]